MLPVIFTTDQSHRPPRSSAIQPMSQQSAAATRAYSGLVLGIHTSASCSDAVVNRV